MPPLVPAHAPLAPAAAAEPAGAGVIYGVCGKAICTIDDRTGKKRTLLRGGSYTAVAVSRSGRRMAFVRSEEVFRAGARGRGAKRVGTAQRQAAPDLDVRADGREIAWIDVVQRPNLVAGGVDLERELIRSEEHTSGLQSRQYLLCRLLLEKKKKTSLWYINHI